VHRLARHPFRHAGVFLLLMAGAFLISDQLLPLNVDAQDVFLIALFLFIAYLGASWALAK
jgi:hypothetical protein